MITIKEIIDFLKQSNIDFCFNGDENFAVAGFCQLDNQKQNHITWIKNDFPQSVVARDDVLYVCGHFLEGKVKNSLLCDQPKNLFFSILNHFFENAEKREISQKAVVLTNSIGKNVSIGPNCFIDKDVIIGDDVTISPNVVIKNKVIIGNRCTIHSMTVIGEDGFGYYENDDHSKQMIKHFGGVVIGDDVLISMNNSIARGTIGDTIIGSGTKISPNSQISHNCIIGKNVTIICSNLYGSVTIGDNSYITYSLIRNQCSVGKNSTVGMGSVVNKNVGDNTIVIGNPAKVLRVWEE